MTVAGKLAPYLALLAFLGAAAPAALADGPATSPVEAGKFIQDLGDRAVALFSSYTPAEAAKSQEELRAILQKGFDLELIGRFVLGSTWRSATPEQKEEYRRLFDAWVINTYARRIGAYKGESFKVIGAQPLAETDAVVETEIDRADGPPLKAGWRVRGVQGNLKIIDVMVEGVSMALTQRQEFSSVIQREGLDGLIRGLRARVDSLKADSTTTN
ncbi:MAG: phospholipid-binding protein MlaC [Alphaproteobacteria bacterium]